MKTRTLATGRAVTVHRNDGLRKRCGCARRAWATCDHPWHFSFKVKGGAHHRFALDTYADHPIRTKDDARDEADRLRILIRGGQFPPTPPPPATTPEALTFEQFAEKWRTKARALHSDNQQLNDAGIVGRLAKMDLAPGDRLGARAIGSFTVDDWETAFAQLLTKWTASTTNKYRQAILALQDWGIDKGYLSKPWLAGKVIKKGGAIARRKGARRDRRLVPDVLDDKGQVKTAGEERRLIAKAGPWLQRLILAALESGMRRGELMGLQWHDVSLSRRQILLRAEFTKTRTMRQVPISPRLLAVLKMIEHDPAGQPHKPTAFVFGTPIGTQVKDPKKAWLKCCTAADVADLQFRDLRHEAASRFLEQGWPLHHVQKMLGHADAKTTSIYLNATITELQDSMTRFGTGGHALHDLAHASKTEHPPLSNDDAPTTANALVN